MFNTKICVKFQNNFAEKKGLNTLSYKTLPFVILLFLISTCREKNDQIHRRIREHAGSLDFALDVVSEVLADRIKKGLLTEDLAYKITEAIFRNNAIELFKLSKQPGS